MKSRSVEEWTQLFTRLGVRDPEQWAIAEAKEDLGNLPKAAFLKQAWSEIPRANDGEWVDAWMKMAQRQSAESNIVSVYKHMLDLGVTNDDLATLFRGVMSQFLYQTAYLLDDSGIEDEELGEIISWGFYEEANIEEPIRRLGCIHELVFSIDPEGQDI